MCSYVGAKIIMKHSPAFYRILVCIGAYNLHGVNQPTWCYIWAAPNRWTNIDLVLHCFSALLGSMLLLLACTIFIIWFVNVRQQLLYFIRRRGSGERVLSQGSVQYAETFIHISTQIVSRRSYRKYLYTGGKTFKDCWERIPPKPKQQAPNVREASLSNQNTPMGS